MTTLHACEVWAEIGNCPHLNPVPEFIQPAVDVINKLIAGFNKTAWAVSS